MELGGLLWTSVLKLALPPQRHGPDAWLEHQEPFIHTAKSWDSAKAIPRGKFVDVHACPRARRGSGSREKSPEGEAPRLCAEKAHLLIFERPVIYFICTSVFMLIPNS